MSEFDLIRRYFSASRPNDSLLLAVGDDCAVTRVPEGHQLAITTDTLVEHTHFLPTITPADLAYKTVAVNLSDLAAMGATPQWVSLALTLNHLDHAWLAQFSQSLFATLDEYQVALIGGDTTKGQLTLTLTAQGFLPQGKGLFRHNAKLGDKIYVSGTLGDSAAGLNLLLNYQNASSPAEQYLIRRHLRPTPRVALGQHLLDYANAAVDISDGLLADLGHILHRSQCGATLALERLPLSPELVAQVGLKQAQDYALCGGEDYELCFTVPAEKQAAVEAMAAALAVPICCIGQIDGAAGALKLTEHGKPVALPTQFGFDHFR